MTVRYPVTSQISGIIAADELGVTVSDAGSDEFLKY